MKQKENWDNKETRKLITALLALKNTQEAKNFLRDLLTESELIEFGNRWKAARMLARKAPYLEIQKETGLSSTTVARVAEWLKNGTGGYRNMLRRMNKNYEQ